MELYIIINGNNSDTIRKRLEFEEISYECSIKPEELDNLIAEKGYIRAKNGLFKINCPNDDKIAVYTDENDGLEFVALLLDLPAEMVRTQFSMQSGTISKFWLQNYAEGLTAPRCIFLNDNTHNYKEI